MAHPTESSYSRPLSERGFLMTDTNTQQVKVFDKTYEMPLSVSKELSDLKERVQSRSEAVRTGSRPASGLRRLLPGTHDRLSQLERFDELTGLVQDYENIIAHVKQSEQAYDQFFSRLADGVREGVSNKCDQARRMEEKRLELLRRGKDKGSSSLVAQAEQSEQRLLASVRMMIHATLLILKKIELCRQSVKALVRDQEEQRRVLEELVDDLRDHREMVQLDQEIGQFEQEVAEIAKVALNFEDYLRDHFGPLQGLLEQVTHVDDDLMRAVAEIQSIAESLSAERDAALPSLGQERQVLEFLMTSSLKQDRLKDALESAAGVDDQASLFEVEVGLGKADVFKVLENVETLVRARLDGGLPQLPQAAPHENHVNPSVRKSSEEVFPTDVGTTSDGAEPLVSSSGAPLVANVVERSYPHRSKIKPGNFMMGSLREEVDRRNDERRHRVTITGPFLFEQTPVTQDQFAKVMGYNPSHFRGERHPVDMVTWFEAIAYCNTVSRRQGLPEAYELSDVELGPKGQLISAVVALRDVSGSGYRLPSESEWEFAARAGTDFATFDVPSYARTLKAGLNALDSIAWHARNSEASTQPVRKKIQNTWDLYDMLGNVWEWVWDWYGPYPEEEHVKNPLGPDIGEHRVVRGGSWHSSPRLCRVAARGHWAPNKCNHNTGFRVARSI